MTNKWRSSEVFAGAPNAGARALWKSMGYCDGDFAERPVIGIANSWNTLVPGHFNLNQVAEQVKKGIHRAGGVGKIDADIRVLQGGLVQAGEVGARGARIDGAHGMAAGLSQLLDQAAHPAVSA